MWSKMKEKLKYFYTKLSGIWRDKTIANKLLYNSNDITQNYERLDTWVKDPINQNSKKVPIVVKPTNKKKLLWNLED